MTSQDRPRRIFLAGGAGAVGRQLLPMLIAAGHDVTATTRSEERARWIADAGARPVVVDVYDADALRAALAEAQPDVVIHQLTDLAGGFRPEDLARNSRLRIVGTRNLVEAALAAGARRMVAQSIAWLYAPGHEPHVESDPLLDPAAAPDNPVLPGVLELERLVTQSPPLEGILLRYGFLYGPGTSSPTPGRPPTVDVAAAACAALLAVERGHPGCYNVVDDGGPVSNARAKAELGWEP